jgi:hypothetical protein
MNIAVPILRAGLAGIVVIGTALVRAGFMRAGSRHGRRGSGHWFWHAVAASALRLTVPGFPGTRVPQTGLRGPTWPALTTGTALSPLGFGGALGRPSGAK